MKRLVCLVAGLILLAVAVSGCADQTGLGKPSITRVTQEWGDISPTTTEILTTITIKNPNPVPIPVKDINTKVTMAGIQMGKGKALQTKIKPNTTSQLKIKTRIKNNKIDDWWVKHLEKGENSNLRVKGNIIFDLKVTTFSYPVQMERPIKTDVLGSLKQEKDQRVTLMDTPAGPVTVTIKSIKAAWGDISSDTTEIITQTKIHNDEAFPIPVTKLKMTGTMNGIKMITGETTTSTVLPPHETRTITATFKLDNGEIPRWWVTHLQNGEQTKAVFDVDAVFEVQGNTYEKHLKRKEEIIKTNILE